MEEILNRLAALEKWKTDLEDSKTIPYVVDRAFKNRGFVKTDYFVCGKGAFGVNGMFVLTIPDSTKNSTLLVTPHNDNAADVFASLQKSYDSNSYGAANSQFDITNPAGTTFRYTWDGTGTNPNISSTTLPIGSRLQIFSSDFNPLNCTAAGRPFFTVTGSGTNYFEIDNSVGVAENNVTIDTDGAIIGGKPIDLYEIVAYGTATDSFDFVVILSDKLYSEI